MDFTKIIAFYVRTLRLKKGISKKQMAESLYCSYSAYCRLESGEVELINQKLINTAKVFNIELMKLILEAFKENSLENFCTILSESKDIFTTIQIKDDMIAFLKQELNKRNEELREKNLQIEQILRIKQKD